MLVLIFFTLFNLVVFGFIPLKFLNRYKWTFYFIYPIILIYPFVRDIVVMSFECIRDDYARASCGCAWDVTYLIYDIYILAIVLIIQVLFNNFLGRVINGLISRLRYDGLT